MIFYFMIRRIEISLQYDYNDRNKNKFRHLYSKVLEIIQIVMDENKDLREKEKEWNEGDYSYDYDYQNCNDDSEITEIKITQSFQIFGLNRNSTMEQIKERYRELSLKYHPDRNKSTDTTTKMTEINSAYEIIMEAMA